MIYPARRRLAFYVLVFALRDIFPVSFFGRDLLERLRTLAGSMRSCVSALLNLMTLTLLVITVTLVAALYVGTVGWLRDYVESNPLARTVEISSIFSTRTATLEAEDLQRLRNLSVPGYDAAVAGVFGWNDVTLWLYDRDGSRDESLTHGRTVDVQDPMLRHLDELGRAGASADQGMDNGAGPFAGDGIGEVVISASLLDALGYGRELPFPEVIRLDYAGLAAPVRIVAVTSSTPAGDFLITEAFHRALQDRRWDPVPRFTGFYWGPVEPSPRLTETIATLGPWLDRQQARIESVRRSGTEQWLRVERREPWNEDLWRQLFLPVLESALEEIEPSGRVEFFEPLSPQTRARERLEPRFTRASIEITELAAVPDISDEISQLGYRVTSNSRELALLFLQVSALGRSILLAVILVVGGLAAISLVLSFSQSIQRKTPEIAILKAYGASNGLVLTAYVLEAVILWTFSAATGLFIAGHIARTLDDRLVALLRLRGDLPTAGEMSLVALPWDLQLAVVGGALVLCIGSTLLAGSLAVRLQPAQALQLHR